MSLISTGAGLFSFVWIFIVNVVIFIWTDSFFEARANIKLTV